MSRCPPTWRRAGAGCRWSSTRPTPARAGPTRSAPGRRGACCPPSTIPGCTAPRSSVSRCAPRSPSLDRMALRAEARAHFGFADDAPGAAGVRRFAGRAVDQPGRRTCGRGPRRGRYRGAACTRPEEHARSAGAGGRRPAVRRRAVPGPDGSRLRRSRSGDLPVGRDDGRRGRRRRAARGLCAAADRQRRAAAQRPARCQRGRRAAGRRRRPHARSSSATRSPGCSATRPG